MTYTTDWIANTFGTNAARIGSCARSMWVAPEGVVYTASNWDENEGGVAIYQNGANAGSIGAHGDFQGGCITGNATDIYTPLAFKPLGSGIVARYSRSTKARVSTIQVSADVAERTADVITGLAIFGHYLYASDFPGNRVRKYNLATNLFELDIPVSQPGALATDRNGNICVAQKALGIVWRFNPTTGAGIDVVVLAPTSRPASLFFDPTTQYLWIGDEGPDQNIKKYNITGTPILVGTFGVLNGYLNISTGIRGQVGDKRFTRVHGIGRDSAGNIYVLNNPWGGTWDLGRDGGTDLHCYSSTGTLKYMLQSLNFEGIAAPDPVTDSQRFYGGSNIYSGSAGGLFFANSVDPFTYPADTRINPNTGSRGEHFGMLAAVGNNRILVACGQNPDSFEFYHFNGDYIAVPDGPLPGTLFNTTARVRAGFCLASNGDVWAGMDKTGVITHWPLTGFDANGKPSWGMEATYTVPATIGPLGRIIYLPETDTLILANFIGTDWTSVGSRVEVYKGWLAGNQTNPLVINLTSTNPKTLAAAGNHLFVGYVHTVPNIDAFNLDTGAIDVTLTTDGVTYVGNDVDSMYGIRALLRTNGEYVVTKDDYNGSSVVVYRWTPTA